MDHEVQDDVDVEAARRGHAEPMALDEQGIGDRSQDGIDRGVVALDVADSEDAAAGASERDEGVRLARAGRDRLLDEHVEPPLEEETRQRGVGGGRCGHHDGVGAPGDLFAARQHDRRLLARHLLGPPFVVIVDAHENDSGGLRRHAGVLAPQMADPDHRQADRSGHAHRAGRLT